MPSAPAASMSRYPTTLARQSFTGAALLASPVLSELTNASIFLRSASMIGDMLPVTSMRNTTSATPLVFARVCGAAAGAASSDCPAAPVASGETAGAPPADSSRVMPEPSPPGVVPGEISEGNVSTAGDSVYFVSEVLGMEGSDGKYYCY